MLFCALKVKPSLKQAVAGMMKSLASGEREGSGQDLLFKWDDSDDEGEEHYHDVPGLVTNSTIFC